jgi:hypothetical protein
LSMTIGVVESQSQLNGSLRVAALESKYGMMSGGYPLSLVYGKPRADGGRALRAIATSIASVRM